VLECVPNVSEGRRRDVVDRMGAGCAACLLDVHSDADHHRTVFTLAAESSDELEGCVTQLTEAVVGHADDAWRDGVHPRLGVLDVVPFVGLSGTADERALAVHAAREFARWVSATFDVPAFLYGEADPEGRSLPAVRREAFGEHRPDFGPAEPHPKLGATAVGARPPLVAVNCVLDGDDVELARRIAQEVRERDGGLPGVRALRFELSSPRRAQVSMNLTDLAATGIERACSEVRRLARQAQHDVAGVELVGLLPRAELARCSAEFRRWAGLADDQTIEGRLDAAGGTGRLRR
jgi:glutamate formiminotransferase